MEKNTAVTNTSYDITGRKDRIRFLVVNSSSYEHNLTTVALSYSEISKA